MLFNDIGEEELKMKTDAIGNESVPEREYLIAEINKLRKKKNAVILAHYYQSPEIQDIADFIGDSLQLSQQAAKTRASIIVFAGVHFMAETAKILNPGKKVVIPDLTAGCSLADACQPKEFKSFIEAHPQHTVISYINCSADIKALSDIICTSSNAELIVNSVPPDVPIIFAPDVNLGKYIEKKTGRKMALWDGICVVHEAFSLDKLIHLSNLHPEAKIIAHPESEEYILKTASFIGSTSAMISFVKNDPSQEFIVATEAGILHKMKGEAPNKIIIPAPAMSDNTCACSECAYMKVNTLEKLYHCLKEESPEINVPEETRLKALQPLTKMLEISKKMC